MHHAMKEGPQPKRSIASIIGQFHAEDVAEASRKGMSQEEQQPTWLPMHWSTDRFKLAVRELFPYWTTSPAQGVPSDRDFYTSGDGFNAPEDKWTRQQWLSLINDAVLSEKRHEQTKFNSHSRPLEKRGRGRAPNADSPWTQEANINALANEVAERMERKIASGELAKIRSVVEEVMLESVARDNAPGRRNKSIDPRRVSGLIGGVYDRVRKHSAVKAAKLKKKADKK